MITGDGRMHVDLRLLRYVAAVAEELHFGRAAQRLHVSQPALSRQVRQLEDDLGVRLFDRDRRHVALTEAGTQLLEAARDVLAAADRFATTAAQVARGERSHLVLGFVGQAANELTPRLLRTFAEEHPQVSVDLHQGDLRDLTAGLAAGRVDLAIVRLPLTLDGLAVQVLLEEPRVAVLPDDSPLARAPAIPLRELFDHPWVRSASADPAYQAFALSSAQRGGVPPRLGPVVQTIDEYLEAVLAHRGIGLAPASAARYYARPGIAYVPVPDAEPSRVALAWADRPDGPGAPATEFINTARTLTAYSGV